MRTYWRAIGLLSLTVMTVTAGLAGWQPTAVAHAATTSDPIVTSPIKGLAGFVDTRTWTSGGGNTFPGADVPFGMVQWSPDTMPDRSDGGGYTYGG